MKHTNRTAQDQPSLGVRLERWIEAVESHTADGPARATLLGAGLGIATVAGGIGMFLLVWFLLVNVLT